MFTVANCSSVISRPARSCGRRAANFYGPRDNLRRACAALTLASLAERQSHRRSGSLLPAPMIWGSRRAHPRRPQAVGLAWRSVSRRACSIVGSPRRCGTGSPLARIVPAASARAAEPSRSTRLLLLVQSGHGAADSRFRRQATVRAAQQAAARGRRTLAAPARRYLCRSAIVRAAAPASLTAMGATVMAGGAGFAKDSDRPTWASLETAQFRPEQQSRQPTRAARIHEIARPST